jgi:uncharacterized membrane protein
MFARVGPGVTLVSTMDASHVEPSVVPPEPAAPDTSSFDTAMAHLYRGEMHRMATWRQRLDITTNWGVITALGMTTFALGSERTPPYILLLGLAVVAICLVIEARRYRHYHCSLQRLRLIEQHYFAGMLQPRSSSPDRAWRARLATDLTRPTQTIGFIAAARFRLRRNYLMLAYFITAAWLTKVFIHPSSPRTVAEFVSRLAVGDLIPSWFVAVTAGAFILTSTALAVTSADEDTVERQVASPEV